MFSEIHNISIHLHASLLFQYLTLPLKNLPSVFQRNLRFPQRTSVCFMILCFIHATRRYAIHTMFYHGFCFFYSMLKLGSFNLSQISPLPHSDLRMSTTAGIEYANEEVWLCSNKAAQTVSRRDLAPRMSLAIADWAFLKIARFPCDCFLQVIFSFQSNPFSILTMLLAINWISFYLIWMVFLYPSSLKCIFMEYRFFRTTFPSVSRENWVVFYPLWVLLINQLIW